MNLDIWTKCHNRAVYLIRVNRGVFIHPLTLDMYTNPDILAEYLYSVETNNLEEKKPSIFPDNEEIRKIVPDKKIINNDENSDNQ